MFIENSKVHFDYSKLHGKIREVCGTQDNFAARIDMGRVSLSQRLNNKLEFTQREILRACIVLGIAFCEIPVYFFTPKVQKHEQKEGEQCQEQNT